METMLKVAFIWGWLCASLYGHQWNMTSIMRTAHKEAEFQEQEEAKAADNDNGTASFALAFLTSSQFVKEVGNLAREQRLVLELLHNETGLQGETLFNLLKEESGCSTLSKNFNHEGPDSSFTEVEKEICPFAIIICDDTYPYRSIDGSCNNLYFPHSGQANRALARILKPDYGDKMNSPRRAKSGRELPSARAVSVSIFESNTQEHRRFTSMHMTFGQLLDHDTDRTPVSMAKINDSLVAHTCGRSGCDTTGVDNEACFPIYIDKDDPNFSDKECLMFVRSQEYVKDSCEIGPRQQPNAITSWLDASFVYGSDKDLLNRLRDFSDSSRGKLRSTANEPLKPLLPQQENKPCKDVNEKIRCFLTGDSRQNEQVALIALHTVFMRLHNYYEENLHQVNPHWGGEKLFQESRRLLIAVWQHIVYNEYLPVVLGPMYCRIYDLVLHRVGYFKGYNPEVYGDVFNVFSTAAFRFGHSQIGDSFLFTDKKYKEKFYMPLSSAFFRPRPIYESPVSGTSGVDAIMFGSVSQPVDATDRFFSEQISRKLFSLNPPQGQGMDLGALNIQRGRDHGIPGYTAWRKWCGMTVPKTFDDIENIPQDVIKKFQKLYEDVDDIDLFAAAMSENAVHSGLVGETFACLIAHQFKILRDTDRFWYETDDEDLRFTPKQLENIRQITLSHILCETLDDIETIQKYSMVAPKVETKESPSGWYQHPFTFKGSYNEQVPCDQHPQLDFNLWKEL